MLLLGESLVPVPDEDAIDGVADPALALCPFVLLYFDPSLALGEPCGKRESLTLGDKEDGPDSPANEDTKYEKKGIMIKKRDDEK